MTDMQLHILNEQLGHLLGQGVHNIGAGGVDSAGTVLFNGLSLKRLMQVSRRQLKRAGINNKTGDL